MHNLYTLIALDLARERSAEAARERFARQARASLAAQHPERPRLATRIRLAAQALAGNIPDPAADRLGRSASAAR